jgi:energy-coupling factor transporter ATP-binding protein EcfA2
MKKPSIAEVENAFQPAREIDSADKFAGRGSAISDSYYALIGDGTNIAVVGNRGIGKSSLARQIALIASGNTALLKRLNLPHDKRPDFLTVYFACGNTIQDVPDLLERLLSTKTCLGDWIYDIPKAKTEIVTYRPELSAKIMGVGFDLGGEKTKSAESGAAVDKHSIETVFTNVCQAIVGSKVASDGLLLIVDEFDQLRDAMGMAGLLKSMATNVPRVKFCLVGVARDIHNLMKEHESADRLFAGSIIKLPAMSADELGAIVRIAEAAIGNYIKFSEDAVSRLVQLAQGHPYMVHLVGKYALRDAFKTETLVVTGPMIDATLSAIAERGADPVLEGRYKKAVASSIHREIVLRALAQVRSEDGECWTTDAYKIALEMGVDNASQYVGHLVTDQYGGEIENVRDRYYRFRDSLFAAYVIARPRLYS